MKRRNKISFSFLLLVSCVFGYLLSEFTSKDSNDFQQTEVVIVEEETVPNTGTAVEEELVAKVTANTVNNKREIKNKVTERIVAFPIKNRNPRVLGRNAFFIRDTISGVEPKYLMSYYKELFSEINIRAPISKIVHHMAVALQKHGYIRYVQNFINNAYTDPVIWSRVLIITASDCSP